MRCRHLQIRFFPIISARTLRGRGVRFCEIGTEVPERLTLAWISSMSAVRTASISAVVFEVLHL